MKVTKTVKTIISGYEKYIVSQKDDEGSYWSDQVLYRFGNNYGASIIFHDGTYGFEQGLVELAVIRWDKNSSDWSLVFDTEITDDVIGYLDEKEAAEIIEKIKEL